MPEPKSVASSPIVYLDGEFLPRNEARVSVMDRGFIFGDGVYEVIPAYGGHLFRVDEHLRRLDDSLAGIRLANPRSRPAWRALLEELVARNAGGDLSVYFQVTRGVAPIRDHAFPADTAPTVFAMATPLVPLPAELRRGGVAAITRPDIRWSRCQIKAITLLANVLLRQEALDTGAYEALLVRDGVVWEGAASNLFVVIDERLVTPPKGPFLLPGITRDLVLELAASHDIPCAEAPITLADLRAAQEVWITSSTKEIVPVTRLDGAPVGNGRCGPLYQRMMEIYQNFKEEVRHGAAKQ